jgi:Flp pilus assembly pilin Flp
MKIFRRWWNDTEGATAVEYAVVLAIIAVVIIGARQFGAATGGRLQGSADQMEAAFPDM